MNFIFRSYPAHPWIDAWSLEPRDCRASLRVDHPDWFFRTQATVGRIVPHTPLPEWALQVPVPQNSRTHLLFNGFCAYYDRRGHHHGAEVLIPEPGVLWGRHIGIPSPALAASQPLAWDGEYGWLEGDASHVLIALRGDCFCVVSRLPLRTEAARLADHYLGQEIEPVLQAEFDRRDAAVRLCVEMAHHDSLAILCAETMMKSLRPPEGGIPMTWIQASHSETPLFDINECFAAALAWRLLDPSVAESLVSCALRLQTNAGAIAVRHAPHATTSVIEAPKPLMAKTARTVWEVRRDPGFLDSILPLLRRHLQWMLHHFDPKRRGWYCWKGAGEMLVPDVHETDMATVDLAILLLTEIDAFQHLAREANERADGVMVPFAPERETLRRNIVEQFWNEAQSAFSIAFVRGNPIQLRGLSEMVPLLWDDLPTAHKVAILERIRESSTLPGGLDVLSWRISSMDEGSFPLLRQLLIFQSLQAADPHGSVLRDFVRVTLQGFVEWHTLSLESSQQLRLDPATAAYIVNVQSIHQYRYHATGTVTGGLSRMLRRVRADRFDLFVLAATLFTLFCVHVVYDALHAPPPFEVLEAQMNSAYANRDVDATIESVKALIHYYPRRAAMARYMAGNLSLLNDNPETAVRFLQEVREEMPDSPGPMIALGLALQLQGRFKEAEGNYYEFCYIFEEIFPELVGEINHWRYLAQEGFRSPPRWKEIYRYQLMHEL